MALELIFNVSGNATKETKALQEELKRLNVSVKGAERANKDLDSSFSRLAKRVITAVGIYKTLNFAFDSVVATGLEYNKQIEQQTASIRTLIAATSDNVDSLGNAISNQEKYALASREATEALEELERINANTPNTLGQTAQIFKTLLPSMRAVGAETEDLVSITEKLSIAANAGGVEFQSLLAGVDGLASGTVLANSDLGRFLSSIGLTNQALKESNDVVALLNEKLGEFEALDTITVAVSNLTVEWQKLTGELTEDIFLTQKDSIKELTTLLKDINQNEASINALRESLNSLTSGAISSASAFARFANGATILFSDIRGGISNTIDFVELGLLGLEREFLIFSRNIKESIIDTIGTDAFGATGINIDFTEQTKQIAQIDSEIQKVRNGVAETNVEMAKTREEGFQFNQVVLDIESGIKKIVTSEKQVTEELEKQSKARTVAGAVDSNPFTEKELQDRQNFIESLGNLGKSQAQLEKQRLQEQFELNKEFIDKSSQEYANYAEELKRLDKEILQANVQANREKTLSNGTFIEGAVVGQQQLEESAKTSAELGRDAYTSFANNSADALAKFASGGKITFSDFARSIISDLVRIAAQQAITGLLGNVLGGFAGGASASGGVLAYNGGLIPEYANGGVVTNFANGGYTGNGGKFEPKGIVHGGEYVFTKQETNQIGVDNLRSIAKGNFGRGTSSSVSSPNIIININESSQSTANVQTRQNEQGDIDVQIDIIEKTIAGRITQGTSEIGASMEGNFGLSRGRG